MGGLNPAAEPFKHSDYEVYGSESGAREFYPAARLPVVEPEGYVGYCVQEPPVDHDAYTYDQHQMDFWMDDSLLMGQYFEPEKHQTLSYYDISGPYLAFNDVQAPVYRHTTEVHEPEKATHTFNAKAPAFTPTKLSKLNPTAPNFLLSRLAIFDPPSGNPQARPRKCMLVLPNACEENITDDLSMLKIPQDGQVGRFTMETTYKFNKGFHHNDVVLGAIYDEVIALRKKDISFFTIKLEVNPVNDAPPLWPPGRNLFDVKAYYFESKEKYGEKKDMLWVTILPHGSPPNADTIHVFETKKQKWVVLGEWLRACYCFGIRLPKQSRLKLRPDLVGWPGYSTHFKWWKYVGSSHRFETLPSELRTKIYEYALGGELYPLGSSRIPQITLGLGYQPSLFKFGTDIWEVMSRMDKFDRHVPEDRPSVYEPQVSMLALNKTIRGEVIHTAWMLMRSCFFNRGLFESAINAPPGAAEPYKYLGKIELNFTNYGYFGFFGVTVGTNRLHITASSSLGPRLQALENLHDLHLRFRTPSDGYSGSALYNLMHNTDDRLDLYDRHYSLDLKGDCQRTVVDWICTFAYPFLIDKCKQGKLKVALTGAVKTDTKEKWEAIFKDKREHDQAAAMADILNKPRNELQVCLFQ
ncbi:hypothetical protein A1F94_001320 [Pyrenophora tritici-repentis]|nr:hypothetical protein A1F94_001320 [Pyrenophora tritici-repentis]